MGVAGLGVAATGVDGGVERGSCNMTTASAAAVAKPTAVVAFQKPARGATAGKSPAPEAAADEPARPALAFGTGTALTRAELLDRVGAAAAHLENAGVGPRDRVAIWGQNSSAWAVWLLACA